MESSNKKLIIGIVVVIALIAASLIFISNSTKKSVGELIVKASKEEGQDTGQDTFNENNSPIDDPILAIGSSGGSGGGSGGGSSSSGSSSCPTQQISYSIQNIQKNIECLEYQGETCVHQSLDCSAEIYNLDNEILGTFKVEIRFIDRSQDYLIIGSQAKEFSLGPGEFETVQGSASLQVQNPELDCFFITINVPKKEIC